MIRSTIFSKVCVLFFTFTAVASANASNAALVLRCLPDSVPEGFQYTRVVRDRIESGQASKTSYIFDMAFDSLDPNVAKLVSTTLYIPTQEQDQYGVQQIHFDRGFLVAPKNSNHKEVLHQTSIESALHLTLKIGYTNESCMMNALRVEEKFTAIYSSLLLVVNGTEVVDRFASCYRLK